MSYNIVFILTDQQRWDTLGCYGIEGVHTPNLDRLAAEGIRYDQCYINATVCTPSRASLWTGKHLPGHGVYRLHDVLPQNEVLFPYHLREAGYDTALFGKLHVAGHMWEMNHRHRFDGFNTYEWAPDPNAYQGCDTAYWRWLAIHHPDVLERWQNNGNRIGHIRAEAHFTTWAANRTVDYIYDMEGTHRPFFCCMSVFDPHNPYTNYPAEYRDLIDEDTLPEPFAVDEAFEHRPAAHRIERSMKKLPEEDALWEERVGYHAAIALIDEQVGRVLEALEETGQADNTIVIFTSDHGDMLGDHGLSTKGAFMYDACTRVPLIIRVPNGPEGHVIDTPCQLHDIAMTTLAIADCEPQTMPDACDLLDEDALESRGYAACMYRNASNGIDQETGQKGYHNPPIHITMWRENQYKLSLYHSPKPGPDDCPGELFDLDRDPDEMNNLWFDEEYLDIRDNLSHKLTAWIVQQDTQGRAPAGQAPPPGFGM